jgi:signal transduction histidine kinase
MNRHIYTWVERFRVQGSGFKVQGSRFKVQGSRFRVQRFRVQRFKGNFSISSGEVYP